MRKITIFILLFIFSVLHFSCGKNYKEISQPEFITTVLPKIEVRKVEVKNDESMLIYTNEAEAYKVETGSTISTEDLLEKVTSANTGATVTYTSVPRSLPFLLSIWPFLYLLFPFIGLLHIILLCFSLRKIIKSKIPATEKLVYVVISIFFPFFGPIIYLTSHKN
ncbi:PLD nuclease N-terminal domain-containing protein [Autumnicola tepida]|uniref:PLD nuclease N-terminal domain-containing protein n=1 Tax=Autumnicola tepida TaxID=3075595 RepID=UPI003D77F553